MTLLTRAIACAAAVTSLAGCDQRAPELSAAATSAAPAPVTSAATAPAAPRLLLELPSSPYSASLVLDGTTPALLTVEGLHHLGASPAPPLAFDKGDLGVVVGGDIVRWMNGELRRRPRGGDGWLAFSRPSAPPQRVAAGREELAWVQGDGGSSASIWTARGAEPRRLAAAPGGVATLSLHDDQVFFVEQLAAPGWRLGAVSISGGPVRYGPPQTGRAPAMLAVTSDVFYYDGPRLSVYRVSTDLRRAERLGSDVICSPLAVADSVYCSQPGAILALPLSGGAARVVTPTHGTVTALSASSTELIWLREASGGGLRVEAISL